MSRIYLYPKYIRLWHMLNALFMLVLIITGLSMQYSSMDSSLISFPLSVRMHNVSGIGLSASYLLFFLGNYLSGNGKHYRIQWQGLKKRISIQLRYYLSGYFNRQPAPYPISEENKFNPLQALSYAMAMYIGFPFVVITGFGLLFPEIILERFLGLNGLMLTDLIHVIMGFLLSIFMIIHIYLCSVGAHPSCNFRSILTGWHYTGDKKD
jgi:thiosulfate reductase cytochrome b subunit